MGAFSNMVDRIIEAGHKERARREAEKKQPNPQTTESLVGNAETERIISISDNTAKKSSPQVMISVSGQKYKNGYCQHCQAETIVIKPKVNHLLHGLASLILINWFIPWFLIWFAAIFFNVLTGYRCSACGKVV